MTDRTKFTDLPISDEVKRAVAEMGFEEATFIQSQSIPLILAGQDVIGHSQTGTGKTAAFGIPIIEKIADNTDAKPGATQALILCPTRELAIQACEEMRKFAKYKHGISVVPIYGGQHIDRQILSLKKGATIVIGTPGRVMDHLRRHTLKLQNLTMLVLDEADEMLNMGFREDIETILQDVPEHRQTILFSATMAPEIMQITHEYLKDPQIVKVVSNELTVPSIRQFYYEVPGNKKIEALARLLDYYNPNRSLVFCNTKRMVDELTDELNFRGYAPAGLHGDMKQQARDTVMGSFRKGKIDILIATDVAARGIDVDDIDAVFNFDLPQDVEYYIHRIGRTGRAGKSGAAYTFVSGRRQIFDLKDIEKRIKTKIDLKSIPTGSEVNEVRNDKLIKNLMGAMEATDTRKYEQIIDKMMEMDFTSVQIACATLHLLSENTSEDTQFDALIQKQKAEKTSREKKELKDKKAKKLLPWERGKDKEKPAKKAKTPEAPGVMASFVLSVGLNDKVNAKHIMEALTDGPGVPTKAIGKISVHNTHAIIDIAANYAEAAAKKMRGYIVNGKGVSMKLKRSKKKQK
ncbi:MAG: DEAD/DEAH box helicase [Defluviitaleaceae bacterium]|nr:DEAD/DEAH box helicase [Defluviitaleaceae bacterium]